jgi:hypothetical protein
MAAERMLGSILQVMLSFNRFVADIVFRLLPMLKKPVVRNSQLMNDVTNLDTVGREPSPVTQ